MTVCARHAHHRLSVERMAYNQFEVQDCAADKGDLCAHQQRQKLTQAMMEKEFPRGGGKEPKSIEKLINRRSMWDIGRF